LNSCAKTEAKINMSTDLPSSIVAKRHVEDCWPCRLVSGFGVIGIGAYLYYTGKKKMRPDLVEMQFMVYR